MQFIAGIRLLRNGPCGLAERGLRTRVWPDEIGVGVRHSPEHLAARDCVLELTPALAVCLQPLANRTGCLAQRGLNEETPRSRALHLAPVWPGDKRGQVGNASAGLP